MNCELCQDLLQQRLDGLAVAEAPQVDHHLMDCARCTALYAASQRLHAGLCLLKPPSPRPALTEHLVAAVLADQRARRRRSQMRVIGYALAASILLGTAFWVYAFVGSTFRPTTPPVAVVKPPPIPDLPQPPTPTPTPSVRDSATDAGNAVASLAAQTVEQTVGQTRLLVPMVTGPSLDEFTMPPGVEPTRSYLETSQGVTGALEPVANSAQRAVNLFRRDLPQVDGVMKSQ